MTGAQVARLEKDERTIQEVSDTRIFIDILEELRWMLLNPAIETSGRVLLQCSGLAVIRWRGIAQISKQFRVPTLLLDATLPEISILRVLHPQAEIVANVSVQLPKSVQIRQLLGAPTSARKLTEGISRLKDREQHLRAVRRYILKRWLETGRQRSLVICQQDVEMWLEGQTPGRYRNSALQRDRRPRPVQGRPPANPGRSRPARTGSGRGDRRRAEWDRFRKDINRYGNRLPLV